MLFIMGLQHPVMNLVPRVLACVHVIINGAIGTTSDVDDDFDGSKSEAVNKYCSRVQVFKIQCIVT